ncbi:MAG: cytochrome P450 [Xanthomonadales bacterium]|nr:cytochrome P450 [Xanthomonadales bacterium]
MLEDDISDRFTQDPLRFLEAHFPHDGGVVRIGAAEYALGDPIAARDVLRNADGRYREHSDFFHSRHGDFGPRAAQLKIRRDARTLVRDLLQRQDPQALRALVDQRLAEVSEWPDAGNRLVYGYLSPLLLAPDSPPKLRALLDRIVERAVLANARARQPRWRRMLLQFQTTFQLSSAIEARQRAHRPQPQDLLDVVAGAAEPGQRLDELSEIYLSFLFAVAGSVGFVLAWSLYLAGTHPRRDVPADWVVREALRLWPVAWQLGRRPTAAHAVAGTDVTTTDEVVVCPYLVHRHPDYWADPGAFRPERWAAPEAWQNPAFIPFGHGPHRCVAADLSQALVAALYTAIEADHALVVTPHDTRPTIAAAMAPPPFRLSRRPRTPATAVREEGCPAAGARPSAATPGRRDARRAVPMTMRSDPRLQPQGETT